MARKHGNQQYADMILRTLASIEIGSNIGGIDYVFDTIRANIPQVDKQVLLDIVGVPGGLHYQKLVDGKILFGNEGHVAGVMNLMITNDGREYVRKNLPKTKIGVCVKWLLDNIVGASISAGVGAAIGLFLGSLVRS